MNINDTGDHFEIYILNHDVYLKFIQCHMSIIPQENLWEAYMGDKIKHLITLSSSYVMGPGIMSTT